MIDFWINQICENNLNQIYGNNRVAERNREKR